MITAMHQESGRPQPVRMNDRNTPYASKEMHKIPVNLTQRRSPMSVVAC